MAMKLEKKKLKSLLELLHGLKTIAYLWSSRTILGVVVG